MRTHPCPKCGRKLRQSGEITGPSGLLLPVFQCDECLHEVDFQGERIEIALTFAVDRDGRILDPSEPEADFRI